MKKLTPIQKWVLEGIVEGIRTDQGELIRWKNIRELSDTVPHQPSRESLYHTVRNLIKHGLVKKGDSELVDGDNGRRWHVPIVPTGEGLDCYREGSMKPKIEVDFEPDFADLMSDKTEDLPIE